MIVSEWIDGDPAVAGRSRRAPRSSATSRPQRYMEFLLVGPGRAGLLHADPHPGNFRLMPDGRLGVIDFGAVKRLPDGLPPEIGRLLGARPADEAAEARRRAAREGSSSRRSTLDAEALLDYLEPFIEPLRSRTFTASAGPGCASVFQHINDPRRPSSDVGMKLNLPPEYLLIHRVWLGGIGVLCQIGGEVPAASSSPHTCPGWTCRRWATRSASAVTSPSGLCTTEVGSRACPRCCAGTGGCRRRRSRRRGRSRCPAPR